MSTVRRSPVLVGLFGIPKDEVVLLAGTAAVVEEEERAAANPTLGFVGGNGNSGDVTVVVVG